jgi:ribosomal protein S25
MRSPLFSRQRTLDDRPEDHGETNPSVRLAIYDSLTSIPRVVELSSDDYREFIDLMSNKTYELSQTKGGRIPYTVIREVVENLIHAYFSEPVITILDEGNTIRIADQGPGVTDKERAFAPGFTTASKDMKQIIRGVGSGLPVASEMLKCEGGTITLEDNLDKGVVVTLRLPAGAVKEEVAAPSEEKQQDGLVLTDKQKNVLFLVTELGPVGPSRIAEELGTSLSSAYRALTFLEEQGFVKATSQGKRSLSKKGMEYLEFLTAGSS